MNKNSAKEWLEKVYHNFSAAKILFEANHYTDVVAVELHYAIEKAFKSFLAFENKKIPKTHDLDELYSMVKDKIELDESEIQIINIASEYHIEESYPSLVSSLPQKEEIKEVINFAEELFVRICKILDIDMQDIIR